MIIHPFSVFRRYWDVSTMMFLFYIVILVPYRIAFNQEAQGFPLVFDRLVDAIFIIDIFLNFITGYAEGSVVVLDPKKIALAYLKSFFFIDVVSGFPLDLIYSGYGIKSPTHARWIRYILTTSWLLHFPFSKPFPCC